jgi:hypothetical protein
MVKVGGEVDSLCTRCELVLAHTVHAVVSGRPVKVECNTCHAVHRYRDPPGKSPFRTTAGPKTARPAREKPAVVAFDELLAARGSATPQPYSPKKRFTVDDVVDHPVFGRGFVTAVRDGDKVEIAFRNDVKLLVHGRA